MAWYDNVLDQANEFFGPAIDAVKHGLPRIIDAEVASEIVVRDPSVQHETLQGGQGRVVRKGVNGQVFGVDNMTLLLAAGALVGLVVLVRVLR